MTDISFAVPQLSGREVGYIVEAIQSRSLAGGGRFTELCQRWIANRVGGAGVNLTQSCTRALELAALLGGLQPGDEVIMPSFTFTSTANAVVLRGAIPVFVDIRPDTLNIDEALIASAITPRTKAITAVHYAGVCAEMAQIGSIARQNGLLVFEDAAQAMLSTYEGRPAGTLGDFGCFSFHQTKNVVSGEGGALIIKDPELATRAVSLVEKGTNRDAFQRGQVKSYTWVDCGSSFLMNELTAAFLYAQLEQADRFGSDRNATWERYHAAFEDLEAEGLLRRPVVPSHCSHNSHLYYLLLPDEDTRDDVIRGLRSDGIQASFHFMPLHSSPAGRRFGRSFGSFGVTDQSSSRLVRLPLYAGMSASMTERVVERLRVHVRGAASRR